MTEEQKEEFKQTKEYRRVVPKILHFMNIFVDKSRTSKNLREALTLSYDGDLDYMGEKSVEWLMQGEKIRIIFRSRKLERGNSVFKHHSCYIGIIEEPRELAGKITMIDWARIRDVKIRDFVEEYRIQKSPFKAEYEYVIGKSSPLSQIMVEVPRYAM
uniref:Uncharacterized protein n=2 Tax=Acidianus brierleyi TaxID=41673 RepID=A0A2U9IF58_9CREN